MMGARALRRAAGLARRLYEVTTRRGWRRVEGQADALMICAQREAALLAELDEQRDLAEGLRGEVDRLTGVVADLRLELQGRQAPQADVRAP